LAVLALSSCLLISQLSWRKYGGLAAFDQLSRDPTLCGVGVYRMGWWDTGGYTHLHQNVPIVLLRQASDLEQESRSINAVVIPGSLSDRGHTFELAGCWDIVCVYRRPGPCMPLQGGNEINYYLWLSGN
jgi:hypothetical protein